uniref:Uncharacterized protein n=1 Tax=Neobodo designis TaxID=312471 RepID=A0A7S1QE52_NEODS
MLMIHNYYKHTDATRSIVTSAQGDSQNSCNCCSLRAGQTRMADSWRVQLHWVFASDVSHRHVGLRCPIHTNTHIAATLVVVAVPRAFSPSRSPRFGLLLDP